jgi:uncharacterized membrane protein YcaP (DUF421 family)
MFGYEDLGLVVLRVVTLFAVALLVVRFMGNRTVGQLSPFDFVILVGIGDIIITFAMDKAQSLLIGMAALVALLALDLMIGYLSLKSVLLRKWFEGPPVTLVEDGHILTDNLAKSQFNFDDLRQELHRQGLDMTRLHDIKVARLESNGVFTVIKNPEAETVTRRDLETYFNKWMNNPLSPEGIRWRKVEQLVDDVHKLVAQQENGQVLPDREKALPNSELH